MANCVKVVYGIFVFVLQIQVQQLQGEMDSAEGDLESLTEQKLKNRSDLLARQQKTKYYQKVLLGEGSRIL